MINEDFRRFADKVIEAAQITAADVSALSETMLVDGLATREEADVLIALDRTVPRAGEAAAAAWTQMFQALLIDFVVWSARPTGQVDAKAARWLVTAANACGGPTENARRAIAAIVREAQRVDETLLVFVMRGGVIRMRDFVEAGEADEKTAKRSLQGAPPPKGSPPTKGAPRAA